MSLDSPSPRIPVRSIGNIEAGSDRTETRWLHIGVQTIVQLHRYDIDDIQQATKIYF